MQTVKARIIVEVPPADTGGTSKRFVVPILPTKTVADLAGEVARRCSLSADVASQLSLTLADGSILFSEDEIQDVIQVGDVLRVALPQDMERFSGADNSGANGATSSIIGQPVQQQISPLHATKIIRYQKESCSPPISLGSDKRVRIAFVTPELARNAGKPDITKKIAFGGSAISVKLTMDMVRREAARTLGWLEDHGVMDVDHLENPARDHIRGTCACTVANQIVTQGRFEQFHCPREVDGSICRESSCSYSHSAIGSGILGSSVADLECKICTELFGFPCEKCINLLKNVGGVPGGTASHCPVVQNAGCGHIFHAHCYFAKTLEAQGCPAGCPTSSIAVEAIPFDSQEPHIVVVHSGAIVEKIPIPVKHLPSPAGGRSVDLTDEDVMDVLASVYSGLGSGLSVRMYGRKNTGIVTFRHSTVVSICCASRHSEDGIRRFGLNGPPIPAFSSSSAVDLHTSSSPILNETPRLTIDDLLLDDGVPDGGEITLYVNKRRRVNVKADMERRVGKAAAYTARDDWHPIVRQTDRGMAAFLSSLLVFANYLSVVGNSNDEKNLQNRILSHFLALTRFPPAVRALYILTLNESLLSEEMQALSETIYHLTLDVSHPVVTKGDFSRVFEGTRILFGILIERSKGVFTLPECDMRASQEVLFDKVALSCGLSGEPLDDPVMYGETLVNRAAVSIRQPGGALYNPATIVALLSSVPTKFQRLVQCSAKKTVHLVVFNDEIESISLLTQSLRPSQFAAAVDKANVELQIHAPLSLRQVVTPALTLDEVGFNAAYIARADPCSNAGEDGYVLRPCHGGEVGVNVNLVATRLAPIIEQRKAVGEWDIDAFGALRADRLDTREIEEAVVVALDLSRSMEEKFEDDEIDDEDENEDDFDGIALNKVTQEFSKRQLRASDVLPHAKSFLRGMAEFPSLVRYIYHDKATTISGRRLRANDAIKELATIFSRLYWAQSRSAENVVRRPVNLPQWENFVAVATDNTLKPQLITYLIQEAASFQEDEDRVDSNSVPMHFLDPLSGEIFVDPVRANDGFIYEQSHIKAWCEHHTTSPLDPTVDIHNNFVSVSSLHYPIRLFLAGRPRASLRSRQPLLIRAKTAFGRVYEYVTNLHEGSILSLLIDYWTFYGHVPSQSCLWHGLRDYGDGRMRGRPLDPTASLYALPCEAHVFRPNEGFSFTLNVVELDHRNWHHIPDARERVRRDSRSMSRLDVVKQAFEAFINKCEAFDLPIAIGLVTFGRQVREVQELTLLKERFRDTLRTVEADGDTPLYDSLSVAYAMLDNFKMEHPAAALRVICLTDGCDVGSNTLPHQIAAKFQRSRIAVDSIVVQTGNLRNAVHPISVVTGGYSFKVDTLENALNIVELETMLRMRDRVERPRQRIVKKQWHLLQYNDLSKYPLDVVTADTCPDRRPHARLHEPLLVASRAAARAPPPSTDRQRRLMQELRDVTNSPHPAIDIYSGSDLAFWKIVIEAPGGSPYEGGTFLAYIDFGPNYPQSAPEVRFITPILHPNINRHGKVCHAALDRSWMVDMTMRVVLQVLYGILLTPDTDNPLDLHATMQYNDDTGVHAQRVHEMVQRHASKSRMAWRVEFEAEE